MATNTPGQQSTGSPAGFSMPTQSMSSPAVLEQQIKLQQLQQLQQLQNQIFQQQMALISGQVPKPLADQAQQFQQQTNAEHAQSSSSYLPTPGPSTELLPQQQNMEFVSPMILNNYMDPDPTSSHSHTPSPMVTSTYHPTTDEMFSQPLPPPMAQSSNMNNNNNSQSTMDYSHPLHRGIASAPEHLAFDIRSGREFDLDVSPLTSPWLGPYGEHSTAASASSSSNNIRMSAHRHSMASHPQHPDERMGGSSNKRTASPSQDDSGSRKRLNSPAIRPTLSNSGMPPPLGTSSNRRQSSSSTHRTLKPTTSTPLLRSTRNRSKSGAASNVQMMALPNPAYDPTVGVDHHQQHHHQHVFHATSNSGHSTDGHAGSGGSGSLGMGGGVPEDSPSPVDLSIPPSSNSNGQTGSGFVPSNGNGGGALASMTPVTPASIMNLGRLGQSSSGSSSRTTPTAAVSTQTASTGPVTRKGKNKADGSSKGLKALLPAGDPNPKSSGVSNDNLPPGQKKTSHKAAEQKRRDSLKTTFDDLRSLLPPIAFEDALDEDGNRAQPNKDKVLPVRGPLLPGALPPRGPPKAGGDGPNKGVSKLQLLICGNSYIRTLKGRVDRRDEEIAKLRREVVRLRRRVGALEGREDMMLDDGEVAMEGEDIDLEKDLDAIEGMTVRIGVVGDTIDEEDEED